MANFTTSTPTTNDPANIYGLLGVGTDNEGKLLDPDALLAAGGATNLSYTASPTQGVVTSDTGNDATIPAADGTNAGLFLPAEKTKLSGIATGAEVNVNADWNAVSGDAQILNKPTVTTDHTALSNIGTNTHAQIDSHIASTTNPHSVTKTQVGLGSVVNSDTTTTANITDSTDKRFVTDAQRTVLGNTSGTNTGDNATNSQYSGLASSKQDTLVSGTNIKTINSNSLLGSGNIVTPTIAIVACSAFDDLPSLGVVERIRFPDAIVLSSVIAFVRSDTLVAGASLITTVTQGANTTTCTIPIGSTSVEVAATWTIAADTEVVFTVTQTATAGQGLKVTLVGA